MYIYGKKLLLIYISIKRQNQIQRGIVACVSIDDYLQDIIKKHEYTLPEKEQDRINHVNYTNAHTGPILMTYRENKKITELINNWSLTHTPVYDFISDDDVAQTVWVIDDEDVINTIVNLFSKVEALYIADGHHRAAAAVKVGNMKRSEDPNHDGSEEYNYFLSVIFPDTQLKILEYNRLIKDLNGLNEGNY